MYMSPHTCWDCPPTFLMMLVALALGLVAFGIAVRLVLNRFASVRALGFLVGAVAVAWLALLSLGSFRHGVTWNDHFERAALIPTLMFTATPPLFLGAFFIRWWRHRRASAG
jgi:hypothetical protein